jgi:ABC-type uncharacterized transport system permease subunit
MRRRPNEDLENVMKSFVLACIAAVAIAAIGGVVLSSIQEPAAEAFSTTGVRL